MTGKTGVTVLGSVLRGAVLGCLGLLVAMFAQSASAGGKKDFTDSADPVQGDWIRPADVVYVGDSESLGYFGDDLYRWLSDMRDPKGGKPLRVWTYWVCGADAPSWARGGVSYCGVRSCDGAGHCARDHNPSGRPHKVRYAPLKTYLGSVKPRLTVVSLGTNILTAKHLGRGLTEAYMDSVRRLIDQIAASGSACIWIGPPKVALKTQSIETYESFVADLRRTVEGRACAFIDSNPLSDRGLILSGDPEGTHYKGVGEKKWAEGLWPLLRPRALAALMQK